MKKEGKEYPKEQQKLKDYLDNVTIEQIIDKLKDDDGMTWWVDYQDQYQPLWKKLYVKEVQLLLDHITSLEEKLETEHKAYMGTVKELTETATRIDKALKCIDENAWFCYKDDEEVIDRVGTKELINILKGE